jgi:integrase
MAEIGDLELSRFVSLHYPNAQPQTVDRQVYTPMVAIWRVAHAAGMCGPHEFRRPKKPEREAVEFASDEQIAALLPVSDSRTVAAILLLSFTGARASEICRVAPADIDWVAQTVLLRKTKNGRPRQVPLAPMVLEALLPLRCQEEREERRGTEPRSMLGFANRWQLNRALQTACEAAGVPVMTSHQIGRHAFAARLLRQGKTLKEVQEAGGWSVASMPMIAATYAHLEKSAVDAAVREADGPLARLVKSSRRKEA